MRILKIFLLFLLFWLQYSLWFGKNGIIDYINIYQKIIIEKKNNEYLDICNNELILEIQHLKNNLQNKK